MKSELEVFMHSAWDKYKMLDILEIKKLAASMDYIADKQNQRRSAESKTQLKRKQMPKVPRKWKSS